MRYFSQMTLIPLSVLSAEKYILSRSSNEGTPSSSSSSSADVYRQLEAIDWNLLQTYVLGRMQKEIVALKGASSVDESLEGNNFTQYWFFASILCHTVRSHLPTHPDIPTPHVHNPRPAHETQSCVELQPHTAANCVCMAPCSCPHAPEDIRRHAQGGGARTLPKEHH